MLPTKHELRRKLGEAYGAWFWRNPGRFAHKPGPEGKADRVRLILEYRQHRAALRAGQCRDEVNARGNLVLRDVDADAAIGIRSPGDRYGYDFGPCRSWVQFDTRQDASYFGVWVHPESRRVFTYCEGDRVMVVCPTPETFRAEIEDAATFYRATMPAALRLIA